LGLLAAKLVSQLSLIIKILAGIVAVTVIVTYLSYQSVIHVTREKVMSGSQVIETKCGSIEYATMGEGPPVLVVHGAGGGYDQGILTAQMMVGAGFRFIIPSRFGFLRTPLPANATLSSQADAYACLLDVLNIGKVAVIGFSNGGPSTLQFALRYPDRVSAVVLVSAVVHKEELMQLRDKIIHYVIFKSDFFYWLITKYLYPIINRQLGTSNDRINFSLLDYQLDQITLPILIVYAKNDTIVNPSHSQYAAQKILNARVITLENGGHALMGQHERAKSEIVKFLKPIFGRPHVP
jgi:2-hydroxy-6-oxonona-2,4-dienedioate hydrolase